MTRAHASPTVAASYRRAEEIARQNLPHLYRVARLFPDRARFEAFCALYASMRWIDDEVDEGRITRVLVGPSLRKALVAVRGELQRIGPAPGSAPYAGVRGRAG